MFSCVNAFCHWNFYECNEPEVIKSRVFHTCSSLSKENVRKVVSKQGKVLEVDFNVNGKLLWIKYVRARIEVTKFRWKYPEEK